MDRGPHFALLSLILCLAGFVDAAEADAGKHPGAGEGARKAGSDTDKEQLVITMRYRKDNVKGVLADITIGTADGNDEEQLLACLKTHAAEAGRDEKGLSKLRVEIQADGRVLYKSVQRVVDLCRTAGISHIRFGTEPKH